MDYECLGMDPEIISKSKNITFSITVCNSLTGNTVNAVTGDEFKSNPSLRSKQNFAPSCI